MPRTGRILALDMGSKRIGLAVTDPLGITAQGVQTLLRKNKRGDLRELRRLVAEYEIKEIVVGLPLHMSGDASQKSQEASDFAAELRQEFGIPVHLWDERLTSTQANRLLRETDMSIKQRRQAVDKVAATLILQSFLEAREIAGLRERNSQSSKTRAQNSKK